MTNVDTWPFNQPRNSTAMTTRQVIEQDESISAIYHGKDDKWQFIGISNPSESNKCMITLEQAVDLDSSVTKVADLLAGWFATRDKANSKWIRQQKTKILKNDPWGLAPGVTPKSIGGVMFQLIARLFRSHGREHRN